ncbi:MAG: hypothetical protein FGM15_11520 [Chthoniobacterales bacterium]|nr:hypothetical protein [Chthoniobacterales bacterium]
MHSPATPPEPSPAAPVHPAARAPRVPLSRKLLWGSGGAADNILYNGMNSLVLPIFNIGLGVDAVKLGFALGLPRILDAVIDPVIGNFSDNLRTRWGRRRPLIFGGVVMASLLLGILFSPPRFLGPEGLVWWFFAVCSLFYVAYAIFVIPYSAQGLELTDDPDDRTRVLAWRPYLGLAVGLAIPWLYKLCLFIGPNEAEGARVVGWIMALAALVTGLIPAIFVAEPPAHAKATPMPLFHSLALTFRNRAFLALTGSTLCVLLGMVLAGPLGLYVSLYHVFGGDKQAAAVVGGLAGTLLLGSGFLGMPFAAWFSALIGKRDAVLWLLVMALAFTCTTWWLFTPSYPWLLVIPSFFIGFALNGAFLVGVSMLGDICDADEVETGHRREGVYSSSFEFGKKVAIALSTLLSGYVLAATGFDPELPEQSSGTLLALRAGYIAVIGLSLVVSAACIYFYPKTLKRPGAPPENPAR